MQEQETQNTEQQRNTHLKGGNWVKRCCPLLPPLHMRFYAFICRSSKTKNSHKLLIYRSFH